MPLLILLAPHWVRAAEYLQVEGIVDLKTTYGDGELDLESLVKLGKERGLDVLFVNDHDRSAMEYGLFPFRNILKKRVELRSINKAGAQDYLDGIKMIQEKYPAMIIIAGSESSPFYFWTGSYFTKDLTAHSQDRAVLNIGLEEPEDYENLPILHNGFSVRYFKDSLPLMLLWAIPLVLGILLLKWRGLARITGVIITALSIVFVMNTAPFRSSPFDQYHGDQGIAPYQHLIDYVNSKGGLTFWNYPETRSGTRKVGPVFFNTPPYPEVLIQSKGYTGFAALYGDTITVTEPGGIWDEVLLQYCRGERARPVWGISTAHFHKDGGAGETLGNFPTVFLVREKTKEEILFAMRRGRMYACRGKYPQRMVLNDFSVYSSILGTKATSGEEIVLKENPRIHISLSQKEPSERPVTVRLMRSGELIETLKGPLPMEVDFEDEYFNPGQKIYYRIDARGSGKLVSNPIFVRFGQVSALVS
ncbi:MAG: hypothetical protein SWQ30_13865 [Thermodesulfobacteriota bacterium]|nr:hypothetical protein [Thermodesulfobacteriota bacterium]